MLDEALALVPRPGSVIAETIGDETMVIDTESGIFYSLRGVASALWALLEGGATLGALVSVTEGRYPDADGVGTAVRSFVQALADEALIAATEASPHPDAADDDRTAWPATFDAPSLDAHRDMNDLLLVDPLHDVDDAGWPHRAS
ncbi:MAG: hypothetical protein AMXMBFR46_23570 [Acidimicrobiia bacterium]